MSEFPRQKPELEIIASDEGFVVRDPARERVHYLNQTGAMVLSLCNGQQSADDIAKLLQGQFDLPEAPLEDVVTLLTQLEEEGLIRSGAGGEST